MSFIFLVIGVLIFVETIRNGFNFYESFLSMFTVVIIFYFIFEYISTLSV